MNETEKEYDARIRSAEREHDARRKSIESTGNQVLSFANAAMRAPALVAAGGVAAALGFYSANFSRLASDPDNLTTFNRILFWLLMSLLLTVLAPGLAYFSQIFFAEAQSKEQYYWEHPFVRETAASRRWNAAAHLTRAVTIALVLASIVCLAVGGFMFLRLVG